MYKTLYRTAKTTKLNEESETLKTEFESPKHKMLGQTSGWDTYVF